MKTSISIFLATINKIVQPDSSQAKQIQAITSWVAAQIDSVESKPIKK